MGTIFSIAELMRDGVAIRADEAVAIAQKLIHEPRLLPSAAPFGPPSVDSVCIDDDGAVFCRGCEATPGVAEIAILLQALLPAGTARVPGALRYIIARALHDVDAPPFDSLDALSTALMRHERGDRAAVVRRLAARAVRARVHADAGDERRRGRATSGEYRRLLREADEKLYRQQIALDSVAPAAAVPAALLSGRRRMAAAALVILAVVLILASAELFRAGAFASPAAALPAPAAWAGPAPSVHEDPEPARQPPVERAEHVRTRPQAQIAPRPAKRTASGFFPKFRIVDDLRKK